MLPFLFLYIDLHFFLLLTPTDRYFLYILTGFLSFFSFYCLTRRFGRMGSYLPAFPLPGFLLLTISDFPYVLFHFYHYIARVILA